jgi:hypothetical protein
LSAWWSWKGHRPIAAFPNCEPQEKLLIIQNARASRISPKGGCITTEFAGSIDLTTMALLDWEEDFSKIEVSSVHLKSILMKF